MNDTKTTETSKLPYGGFKNFVEQNTLSSTTLTEAGEKTFFFDVGIEGIKVGIESTSEIQAKEIFKKQEDNILALVVSYDWYTLMIDDAKQQKQIEAKNKSILDELGKLKVKQLVGKVHIPMVGYREVTVNT